MIEAEAYKSSFDLDRGRCPLETPTARKSNILQFARQERDERVIAQASDSSMTAQEREAMKQLEPASRSPKAKASRRKPIPKATPEVTQVAFAKYVEQTNSDKPKKPR